MLNPETLRLLYLLQELGFSWAAATLHVAALHREEWGRRRETHTGGGGRRRGAWAACLPPAQLQAGEGAAMESPGCRTCGPLKAGDGDNLELREDKGLQARLVGGDDVL